ncbi:MAG TPA: ABC transporter ATP-binding protein [Thermoanaerobaculia bacterium]
MIKTTNLTKAFGKVTAVKGVTIQVRPGEIFGLIGPNGAGKTTVSRLLSGILKPSSGEVWIGGLPLPKGLAEVRRLIGVVPEGVPLYRRLTARETIRFFGRVHGVEGATLEQRIAWLAERLQLDDQLDKPNEGLSLGTKKKVLFASALLHDPQVLICDEPTLALDPRATQSIIRILTDLKADGRTILLTSHNMDMVDQLCNQIAVIHKGQIRIQGPPQQIKRELAAANTREEVVLDEVFLHYTA